MVLSTRKRITSGICFGRKVSSTVPRESNRDDVRFLNCNRLGCSIKHIFMKGVEVDPEESSPAPPQKPQARMGLKRFKERKKVASLPHRDKPGGELEPRTPEYSEGAQDSPTEDSSGASGSPTGERRQRIARCMKYGNHGSSSSSRSSSTSSSSPWPGRQLEGPHTNATGSSPSTVDRKMVPSQTRGSPCRGVAGPRPGNASARSRTTISLSFPRPQPIPRAAAAVGDVHSNSSEAASMVYRFDIEEELAVNLFGGETLDANGGASQSLDSYGDSGDTHDLSNPFGFAEALYELTGLAWGSELPLEVVAFEAAMLERQGWHDEHRDMRLDIDGMTYEELLALGEKLGTVSTALAEEVLLKCVERFVYRPLKVAAEAGGRGGDNGKCSICQEEYVDGDEVGKLLCHHLYHMGCIRQWFRLKNWCPVCKLSASPPP